MGGRSCAHFFSKTRNAIIILNMNSYCSEQHARRNVHRQGKAFLHPQLSKTILAQGTSHLRDSCSFKSERDELILLGGLTPEAV